MASQAAKELAAQQKAERKARKLAKKNSKDPKDWGFFKQLKETYKMTAEQDPKLNLYLILTFLAVVVVAVILAIFLQPWWMWIPLGLLGGLTAAMYMLTHRSTAAMYKRFDGKPGSAEVALRMLNKKKYTYEAGVAFNKQMDMVHRVVGPAGIVLIGEGPIQRLRPLMADTTRRHKQVTEQVPVIAVFVGHGEGEIPLDKLAKYIKKLPKKADKLQIADTKHRLKALDAQRGKLPIPKGPMPNARGVGRQLRGR
ncbi:MAG: DUF4191 domain-containing protein [Propionibacteriaceae bacterium]|jgi:hypothetical protein|nr:DUF4191 domain-containing protein [Propionibacteriaceae bacterium]